MHRPDMRMRSSVTCPVKTSLPVKQIQELQADVSPASCLSRSGSTQASENKNRAWHRGKENVSTGRCTWPRTRMMEAVRELKHIAEAHAAQAGVLLPVCFRSRRAPFRQTGGRNWQCRKPGHWLIGILTGKNMSLPADVTGGCMPPPGQLH